MTGHKIEQGTQVRHKDNPSWKGVVVQDLNPLHPVNGFVMVRHISASMPLCKMPKSLLVELPLPKDYKNSY
ncbi:MAG: hypothetical protein CMI54_00330 [Parcubacteria group bacterium]|nr:hypothetical protein [Parcubacteria group bacterium]|tara:strand:- start:2240 stop:2452 length:213 start_codon:yes stop_codon:yes gene_type:complete